MNSPFVELGLSKEVVEVLTGLGYEEPTPIQSESIPPLLAGKDLLGQAATGTGKTAAFALPLLQRALAAQRKAGAPAVLVLVPTRELAIQVAEAFHSYGGKLGAVVLPIYGGAEFGRQAQAAEARRARRRRDARARARSHPARHAEAGCARGGRAR